jgi:hypothetical protein
MAAAWLVFGLPRRSREKAASQGQSRSSPIQVSSCHHQPPSSQRTGPRSLCIADADQVPKQGTRLLRWVPGGLAASRPAADVNVDEGPVADGEVSMRE